MPSKNRTKCVIFALCLSGCVTATPEQETARLTVKLQSPDDPVETRTWTLRPPADAAGNREISIRSADFSLQNFQHDQCWAITSQQVEISIYARHPNGIRRISINDEGLDFTELQPNEPFEVWAAEPNKEFELRPTFTRDPEFVSVVATETAARGREVILTVENAASTSTPPRSGQITLRYMLTPILNSGTIAGSSSDGRVRLFVSATTNDPDEPELVLDPIELVSPDGEQRVDPLICSNGFVGPVRNSSG